MEAVGASRKHYGRSWKIMGVSLKALLALSFRARCSRASMSFHRTRCTSMWMSGRSFRGSTATQLYPTFILSAALCSAEIAPPRNSNDQLLKKLTHETSFPRNRPSWWTAHVRHGTGETFRHSKKPTTLSPAPQVRSMSILTTPLVMCLSHSVQKEEWSWFAPWGLSISFVNFQPPSRGGTSSRATGFQGELFFPSSWNSALCTIPLRCTLDRTPAEVAWLTAAYWCKTTPAH